MDPSAIKKAEADKLAAKAKKAADARVSMVPCKGGKDGWVCPASTNPTDCYEKSYQWPTCEAILKWGAKWTWSKVTLCQCGGAKDCFGVVDGKAKEDCNGKCGGTAMKDCNGKCGGTATADICGVCQGDGSTCKKEVDFYLAKFENSHGLTSTVAGNKSASRAAAAGGKRRGFRARVTLLPYPPLSLCAQVPMPVPGLHPGRKEAQRLPPF